MDGTEVEQVEVEQVWLKFSTDDMRRLRLATGHTTKDCGAAVGVSGTQWWRWENAEQTITAHRREAVARFLERLRDGERMETGASADGIPVLPLGDGPNDDVITERARQEAFALAAAASFMDLGPLDLAAAARDWDNPRMREMRRYARRCLRKRIENLGVFPPGME